MKINKCVAHVVNFGAWITVGTIFFSKTLIMGFVFVVMSILGRIITRDVPLVQRFVFPFLLAIATAISSTNIAIHATALLYFFGNSLNLLAIFSNHRIMPVDAICLQKAFPEFMPDINPLRHFVSHGDAKLTALIDRYYCHGFGVISIGDIIIGTAWIPWALIHIIVFLTSH